MDTMPRKRGAENERERSERGTDEQTPGTALVAIRNPAMELLARREAPLTDAELEILKIEQAHRHAVELQMPEDNRVQAERNHALDLAKAQQAMVPVANDRDLQLERLRQHREQQRFSYAVVIAMLAAGAILAATGPAALGSVLLGAGLTGSGFQYNRRRQASSNEGQR